MMRNKLRSIERTSTKWVVISVNPLKCPKDSLRFCLANNIVLSSATIPSSAFDGIWTLSWSDQPGAQQRWLYEPRLESFAVTHFRGDHTYTDEAIADLISVGAAARAHIVGECRESSVQRMAHYQKAKNTPILAIEQGAHEGIPLRRCPACLDATPSRMTYCLCCNAEFLGQYHGEGHRHGQAASAAPYRVPPKAPDIKSKRASSAPPTTIQREVVKLNLPEIDGLKWKVLLYTQAGVDWEYVVPETRIRQAVDSAGANTGWPSFLAFRDGQAHGSYLLINYIYYYNIGIELLKKINAKWPPKEIAPDHVAFTTFLRSRPVPGVGTLENLLHPPQKFADGWNRYGWTAFDEDTLDETTQEGAWSGTKSNWQDAWHGTKLECLYKTMTDGCLSEKTCLGRRIKDGKPGVYMFKDEHREKALYYARRVCLNDDGMWVRFMWEVMTDRNDSVKSGNDQWIGRERSVHLKALWVQFVPTADLEWSDEVQWAWDPALEFQPVLPTVTKGKGKGNWPIPPVLHPTADPNVAASPVSIPGHPAGSEGISKPAMDVDEGEGISTSASTWESIQLGKDDYEYLSAVLQLQNDIYRIQEVARTHVHSPKEWSIAWKDILVHRADQPGRALAAKILIWLQTHSVLNGTYFHHGGIRLLSLIPI